MPAPMDFSRPGRAPEPLTGRRRFPECYQGKHADCPRLDADDWGRFSECSCPCHKTPTRRRRGWNLPRKIRQ